MGTERRFDTITERRHDMIARFWNPLWIQIWARLWSFFDDFHFLATAMVDFLYCDIPLSNGRHDLPFVRV
jgi:hypothetical protein